MSKIRDLRRQAQQELRAHRFEKAVALYQKICESEKSNAGYRNELGDIHLKMGELPEAVRCFREAASLYRDVGLTNNAVAILKKVLRQDPHHFDSLWELGEIRSEQGLETEAVRSFLDYLRTADAVPEDGRESFLRRSAEVLDRWGQEPEVLAELDSLFERWGADQERAQVLIAKAALARSEGEHDIAEKYVEHARRAFSDLEVLPAYAAYVDGQGPGDLPTTPSGEVPTLTDEPSETDEEDRVDLGDDVLDLGFDFDEQDLSGAIDAAHAHEQDGSQPVPLDDEPTGPHSSGFSLEAEPDPDAPPEREEAPEVEIPVDSDVADPRAFEEPADAPTEDFDLLSEILSDGDVDFSAQERDQIDTIASEVEGQMAGNVDPSDYAGQYDLGMVYADMGLTEQAVTAFLRASEAESFRLRALEMAGGCRLEAGDCEGAIELLEGGLEVRGHSESAYVGLLYFLGRAHAERGERDQAIETFERVALIDAHFKDVAERLRTLHDQGAQL